MTDYHFKYSGEVIIAADTYEEAEKLLKNMMWDVRGVYNYHIIHSSVSLADNEDTKMTKSYISCYNMPNKELEHFEVPDPVYVYIRQLENAIKYDTNGVKRLYPFRFGEAL